MVSMQHMLPKHNMWVNPKPIAQVSIKRGIFLCAALPSLLFCIGRNPLSQIIAKTGYKYQFQRGTIISHILYMYDIKMHAKNEWDTDSRIRLIRIYSKDIGMPFRLDKCSQIVCIKVKVITTYGVELAWGNIAGVQDSYKYLGMPQTDCNHDIHAARKSVTTKYLQRVTQVLKSAEWWTKS